jgi:thioredoxin-like negative regulator of GroEL
MKKILYFSATWCQPCKNFKPIMEQVSCELPVQFVDVDASPQLVAEYGIKSVPTVIIINNGQVTNKQAGVLTEIQIKSLWSQN